MQGYLPDFDLDAEYPGIPAVATSMTLTALHRIADLIEFQLGTVQRLQGDAEMCVGPAASERARQLLEETHGEYAQALRRALTPATRTVTVFELYTRAINLSGLFFWTAYHMHPKNKTVTAEQVLAEAFDDASVGVLDYGVDASSILRSIRQAQRNLARHALGLNQPMILEHVEHVLDTNTPAVCPSHFKAAVLGHPKADAVISDLLLAERAD